MSDVVLRAGARPAMTRARSRRAGHAEHARHVARGDLDEVRRRRAATASGSGAPPRNARSRTIPWTRAVLPFRRDPGARRDAQRGCAGARRRSRCRRAGARHVARGQASATLTVDDVRHLGAEIGQDRVGDSRSWRGRVRRRGKDHRARVESAACRTSTRHALPLPSRVTRTRAGFSRTLPAGKPTLDRGDQLAHAAAQRLEHAVARRRRCRRRRVEAVDRPRARRAQAAGRPRRSRAARRRRRGCRQAAARR